MRIHKKPFSAKKNKQKKNTHTKKKALNTPVKFYKIANYVWYAVNDNNHLQDKCEKKYGTVKKQVKHQQMPFLQHQRR